MAGGPIPGRVAAQVRDARVILHGEVESPRQRDAAESAARHLTGVRVVDNTDRAGHSAPPTGMFDDRAAKVDYLVLRGDKP